MWPGELSESVKTTISLLGYQVLTPLHSFYFSLNDTFLVKTAFYEQGFVLCMISNFHLATCSLCSYWIAQMQPLANVLQVLLDSLPALHHISGLLTSL